MDRRDSKGFFSKRLMGRSSDSSFNKSLVTLKYRELLDFPRVYQNCLPSIMLAHMACTASVG